MHRRVSNVYRFTRYSVLRNIRGIPPHQSVIVRGPAATWTPVSKQVSHVKECRPTFALNQTIEIGRHLAYRFCLFTSPADRTELVKLTNCDRDRETTYIIAK